MSFTLEQLNARIAERAKAAPSESYTSKLLAAGIERCAQKLGEEAVETVIAATARNRAGVAAEAGDLLYHLLVLLKASDVPLQQVMAELESRTLQSGLAEKAARPNS
jgi:phosphoribosyl-ATP pyrophosphohydrolase